MNFLRTLVKIADERVAKYGAQYVTFSVFGIINYSLAFLYKLYTHSHSEELWLRGISTILCFILLLKDKWPNSCKKYLPIYWYFTITVVLPMLLTFMLLLEQFSLGWLVNFNIGIMIIILILDSLTFLFATSIGIILGLTLFYASGYSTPTLPNSDDTILFIYMFLCVVVLGTIFTRNKELFNHYLQKTKDNLNESLEQKVKERTAELEKALAVKTEFLNNLSHEIRTPVLGFTSISEGLVENWDILNSGKKLKYAKDISNSAQRLGSLISNLLDLSTFVANKMYIIFVKVDLNALLEEIINETKILYANDKVLHINYTPVKNYFVKVDKGWMLQVFRHLFSNAVKFSHDNGIIKVTLKKIDGSLHFSIADAGIGIPESEIKDIFIPFTQSSLTKTRAGGRGLGLAICKEIIEAHHGKIWAENNVKGGATFYFIIPINI